MDDQHVEKYVRMARARAAECLPFFAEALYAARLVIAPACPALAAVDQYWRVYFNPTLVRQLLESSEAGRAVPQLAWVWVHEISHLLRDHAQRARDLNAAALRWNIAADLEINDAAWPGLAPPEIYPPLAVHQFDLPRGELAEAYYHRLAKSGPLLETMRLFADEGSGVHGQASSWELTEQDGAAPALSPGQQAVVRLQVAKSLEAHGARGHIAAGWQRWIDGTLRPQVDWRRLLLRRLRGAASMAAGHRIDYSYKVPHRRAYLHAPLIRPTLAGPTTSGVACVIDTSGSMGQRELAGCLAEVRGVLEQLHLPVTIIPCDCVAYEPIRIMRSAQLNDTARRLTGGGGTSVLPGIEAALRLSPAPSAVLVLTDGYTDYPAVPYATPVLFGIITQAEDHEPPVPDMPPWRPRDVVRIRI